MFWIYYSQEKALIADELALLDYIVFTVDAVSVGFVQRGNAISSLVSRCLRCEFVIKTKRGTTTSISNRLRLYYQFCIAPRVFVSRCVPHFHYWMNTFTPRPTTRSMSKTVYSVHRAANHTLLYVFACLDVCVCIEALPLRRCSLQSNIPHTHTMRTWNTYAPQVDNSQAYIYIYVRNPIIIRSTTLLWYLPPPLR